MKNYANLPKSIGIVTERLCREKHMTKVALADFSELQNSYLRSIIKGERNPTISALYAIADVVGISFPEFAKLIDEEFKRQNEGG